MEIAQAIKKRRTIHIFSNKSVPRAVIEKSIVAANQAPCHRRTFPWRFTKIGMKKTGTFISTTADSKVW